MNVRNQIQNRERNNLAPWAMMSNDTRGREHEEDKHPYRTPFQRDRDRIIHCTAFRRLQYKTQVFVIHEGDYYRTRLTHTTEVAQISRTIARALGANVDLCEAIALSHDLGHTPFGHSGEKALNKKLMEVGIEDGFRHNRQSLRILDTLENRYPEFRGLNLTWELRESIIKHGFPDNPEPDEKYQPSWAPLIEEQIVDVTDSIAYTNHDIDDGLKSGILNRSELEELELYERTRNAVHEEYGDLHHEVERVQIVRKLINLMVTDLLNNTEKQLNQQNITNTDDVRKQDAMLVSFSDEMKELKAELNEFLYDRMYCHHKVIRMQERAKRIVRELFDEFMRSPESLPREYQDWANQVGKPRGISDYIAGMTDRYAIQEHEDILGPLP